MASAEDADGELDRTLNVTAANDGKGARARDRSSKGERGKSARKRATAHER